MTDVTLLLFFHHSSISSILQNIFAEAVTFFESSSVWIWVVEEGLHGCAHHETPWGEVSGRLTGLRRSPLGLPCSALPDASHAFFHLFSRPGWSFFNLFCRPAGSQSTSRSPPVLTPGRPCLSLFNDAEPGGGLHLIMAQPRALIG